MARGGAAALLAVAVLLAAAPPAAAKDIVVGGAVGWGLGMQYPAINAEVGDTLVFNYMRMHDVWALPGAACGFEGGSLLAGPDASPYRQQLTQPGTLHFSCSTAGHCAEGQLVTVNVAAPGGGAGPPPPRGAQCARFLNTFASC